MMPELFLADALGCTGKPMFRVHTAGSVGGSTAIVASQLVAGRHPRAGAHRRLREAVRERGHVGPLAADPVHPAAARRRRRLLRPAHPQLHPPGQGARPHRHAGGAEGPAERAQEPLRPPPRARDHLRLHQGVDDAVGPDPLRRDLPVVRRRLRPGARQREGGRRGRGRGSPAGVDPGHGHAVRAHAVGRARHGAAPRRRPVRGRRLQAGRHHQPAQGRRLRRDVRAVLAGSSPCGWRTSASPSPATAGR